MVGGVGQDFILGFWGKGGQHKWEGVPLKERGEGQDNF